MNNLTNLAIKPQINLHAAFSCHVENDIAFLRDHCNELKTKSITNDADQVVKYIGEKYPNVEIIFYKDSIDNWGELRFNRETLEFIGYKMKLDQIERNVIDLIEKEGLIK